MHEYAVRRTVTRSLRNNEHTIVPRLGGTGHQNGGHGGMDFIMRYRLLSV